MLFRSSRVLIVEDNDINLQLAEELLIDVGIQFSTARNGLEALNKVSSEQFDAVLMDIQMPEMSGLDLLTKVKELDPEMVMVMITAF